MKPRIRWSILLKGVAAAAVAVGLGIALWRLERERPVNELERAGATVINDSDGQPLGVAFSLPEAGDKHMSYIAALKTVTTVTLTGSRVTSAGLARLRSMPELEYLDISDTPDAAGSLEAISQFPALRTLHLRLCKWLQDDDLAALEALPQLETLVLVNTPVTDRGLVHVGRIDSLLQLELDDCQGITDAGLATLPRLHKLVELSIDRCPRVTGAGLEQASRLPNLVQLSARGLEFRGEQLQALARAHPKLRIEVDRVNFSELEALFEWGATLGVDERYELISVELDGSPPTTDLSRSPFELEHALHVPVSRAPTERGTLRSQDEALALLRGMPELESLLLRSIDLTDDSAPAFKDLPRLTSVILDDVHLTPGIWSRLASRPELELLWLRDVAVPPEAWGLLRNASKLTHLTYFADNLSAEVIAKIGTLVTLESVVLGTGDLASGLEPIAALPQLNQLDLVHTNLTVSDARTLASAAGLERVYFVRMRIDAEVLTQLAEIEALRMVGLRGCDFEEEAVSAFESLRPDVSVRRGRGQSDDSLELLRFRPMLGRVRLLIPDAPTPVD